MTDTTLLRVCWGFGAFGMVVLTALEWARGDWWTPLPVWLTCGLVLWAARGVWRAPPAPARPREDDGALPR
jgi:hypothetical protein